MNILYICDEYPPCKHGGIGTVTQNLARILVERGNNVVVVGFYPYLRKAAERENDNGVKVYRFFYGSKWKLFLSRNQFTSRFINIRKDFYQYIVKLRCLIAEYKIEIIEIPDFVEAFRYGGLKKISFPDFGVPTVLKVHGSQSFLNYYSNKNTNNVLSRNERNHILNAKHIIAVSSFSKTFIKDFFKHKGPVKVIHNGVLVNKKASEHNPTSPCYAVYAGKLSETKGTFNLIRSWQKVHREIPESKLYIYGNGSKKIVKKLKEYITCLNLDNFIQLKGFIEKEELLIVYNTATCAIFPSFIENFSLAPMEAMQAGCPTIYTKLSSGPELIQNQIDGILVDPNNLEDIADAIIVLLKDHNKAKEIGYNGMQRINTFFDIHEIASQHMDFYKVLKYE